MTSGTTYAVSVKSSTGPRLLCRLRRAPTGIYFLIPHPANIGHERNNPLSILPKKQQPGLAPRDVSENLQKGGS